VLKLNGFQSSRSGIAIFLTKTDTFIPQFHEPNFTHSIRTRYIQFLACSRIIQCCNHSSNSLRVGSFERPRK
jgi:hypothetical protein